jgi:flagellar basal body-associated protein FliL
VQPVVRPAAQPVAQAPRQPVSQTPPVYSGYVPASPVRTTPKKKFPVWVIILIIVVLIIICACAATIWYIDKNYLWCNVLPFLPGCQ